MHAKVFCVITSFLDYKNIVTYFNQLMSHPEAHQWAQFWPPNRVSNTRVKPTAYNDNIRLKLSCNRQQNVVTCISVFIRAKIWCSIVLSIRCIDHMSSIPCNVDLKAFALAFTNKKRLTVFPIRPKCPTVSTVKWHEQNLITIVESILSAITLMDIPIKY